MSAAWLQYVASGLTAGAIYALVALGFSIIYNASGAINFAQGEFVMIGGMSAATMWAAGLPLPAALALAVVAAVLVALVVEKLAIEPARHAGTVTLIIITIGVSLFLRGLAQLIWGKGVHRLPAFSSEQPIAIMGATVLPQSLWVMAGAAVAVAALSAFYGRTLMGKAMLATSYNRLAAQLVGINTRGVLFASFGLAAALGALAGVLIAPSLFLDVNFMGAVLIYSFAAATLGGFDSPMGAVIGGWIIGVTETLAGHYVDFIGADLKILVPLGIIITVLLVRPTGLFGSREVARV
jgi:branched-chain amino acid transport system permease protein